MVDFENELSCSNYSFVILKYNLQIEYHINIINFFQASTKSKKSSLESSAETIAKTLSNFIAFKQDRCSQPPPPEPVYVQKYAIMMNNLDRMLQQLDARTVEKLYFKFTQLAFDEIEKKN